jgi:hypothetical protein
MSALARTLRVLPAALAALLAAPIPLWAQAAEPLSSQRLGRPYLFVFLAYIIVLGLIALFVVSMSVRLARVEKRLQGD